MSSSVIFWLVCEKKLRLWWHAVIVNLCCRLEFNSIRWLLRHVVILFGKDKGCEGIFWTTFKCVCQYMCNCSQHRSSMRLIHSISTESIPGYFFCIFWKIVLWLSTFFSYEMQAKYVGKTFFFSIEKVSCSFK